MMEENPKALESVPIFITGWWASLERKKRIKLIAFVILYIFMFVSVCVMVTDDSILVHKMRLRALQAPGLSLQQVRFDLALIKRIGFHSDHNKGFEYQLPKEIRLETSKAYSTNSVETFVRNHINTAINVWQTCVRRSHRARSFRAITHIILIMGLLAIRSAPALFILNRIWMIRAVSVSSQLFAMAYLLLYATSLEYQTCLTKSGTQRIDKIVPTYEFTLVIDWHTAIRSIALTVLIGIPMLGLGGDLFFSKKGNL